MDDAGPVGIVSAPRPEREELPGQRRRRLPGAGMHRDPCRLLHDDDVVVLERERHGDGLGAKAFRGLGQARLHDRSRLEPVALLDDCPVDRHGSIPEEALGERA